MRVNKISTDLNDDRVQYNTVKYSTDSDTDTDNALKVGSQQNKYKFIVVEIIDFDSFFPN